MIRSETSRFPTSGPPLCLAQVLRAVPADLVETLVTHQQLRAAVALAETLPPIWRWCMLETRLTSASRQVDFMACFADVDNDRERVAAALPELSAAALGSAFPLVQAWAYGEHPMSRDIPIVWLEWDMPDAVPAAPLVSGCLDVTLLDQRVQQPSLASQLAMVEWVVAQFPEFQVHSEIRRRFASCLGVLPSGARLLHVAPLQARGLARLRFTLGLLPAELIRWLHAIEWPGDLQAVYWWIAHLAPPWQRVFFQVEMDDRVHPHLSIETRTLSVASDSSDTWYEVLHILERSGLVQPERAQAVLRWPGTSAVLLQDTQARLRRSCYLKLVLNSGVPQEAKAYLGLSKAPDLHS
jgi:hypothetical protein